MVVCDDVTASLSQDRLYTLQGVRLHREAATFPDRAALSLFLLLSSPRRGNYAGKILVVNERNNRPIRYVKLHAAFPEDDALLPLYVAVGHCIFPEPGLYNFEVYFSARDGNEVLKGEHPFTVVSR